MKMQAIRVIARGYGIKPLPATKRELIRAIQHCEGNFPCFGTPKEGHCDQPGCIWREDCLSFAPASRH